MVNGGPGAVLEMGHQAAAPAVDSAPSSVVPWHWSPLQHWHRPLWSDETTPPWAAEGERAEHDPDCYKHLINIRQPVNYKWIPAECKSTFRYTLCVGICNVVFLEFNFNKCMKYKPSFTFSNYSQYCSQCLSVCCEKWHPGEIPSQTGYKFQSMSACLAASTHNMRFAHHLCLSKGVVTRWRGGAAAASTERRTWDSWNVGHHTHGPSQLENKMQNISRTR